MSLDAVHKVIEIAMGWNLLLACAMRRRVGAAANVAQKTRVDLECSPADSTNAASCNDRDLGMSRWQL
jgi:hypothetical protein